MKKEAIIAQAVLEFNISTRNVQKELIKLGNKIVDRLEQEWINVEDRLPEVSEYGSPELMVSDRVFCFTNTYLKAVGYLNNGVWIYDAKGDTFHKWGYEITHWMPLPLPPQK